MKKIIFSLAFLLIGSFTFANNYSKDYQFEQKEIVQNQKESGNIVIKMNENCSKAALDCKENGGVCLVTIYTNGVPRSFERCCNDIIIVKRPDKIQ